MNIILVSGNLAKAHTISLSWKHFAMAAAALVLSVICVASLINVVLLRNAASLNIFPLLQNQMQSIQKAGQDERESYMQESLNAMAKRLGEMQANLLRLDTLGERLAKLAGLKGAEFQFNETPGRGGAMSSVPSRDFSVSELSRDVDMLTRKMDDRGDKLSALESLLTVESAKRKLVPTMLPVIGGSFNSNYGWRIDPFTGQQSLHEGIDFAGGIGTPILAAAGGVVINAEFHPSYGNIVEIDHGNDLVSRYAHLSKFNVKAGDMVLRGTKIAEMGSTGRSTGAHLHFEVHQRGMPVNPAQFLQLPG